MLGIYWRVVAKALLAIGLSLLLVVSPFGHQIAVAAKRVGRSEPTAEKLAGKISEVSPPAVLQELRQPLDDYQPQVTILNPIFNQVLSDNSVSLKFQVKDLPIFKNETLGLGPHLHVFLDNQPYQAVYDASKPLVLDNLAPGTHSLRVFASRPWHESFKNEGAYAQTTFHVFTKTEENSPNSDLPLLTYSRPQASYGAEPIMLDFYLTNAPLHLVAQESSKDEIADWRIRVTVNGDRFVLDRWQPIYLKGFKPGKNWVQLEFLDEKGHSVNNVFNNTARLITYEPNGTDTLSKLVRGELSAAAARGIVDPNYVFEPKPEPTPSPSDAPTPNVEPTASPLPVGPVTPIEPPADPTPTLSTPKLKASPQPTATPTQIEPVPTLPEPSETKDPDELETSDPSDEVIVPAPAQPSLVEQPKSKPGFFNRFRSQPTSTSPTPTKTTVPERTPPSETTIPDLDSPQLDAPKSDASEAAPETDAEAIPLKKIPAQLSAPEAPVLLEPIETAPTQAAPTEASPNKQKSFEQPRSTKFFDRFRRSATRSSASVPPAPQTLPEIIDATPLEEIAPDETPAESVK